jgi:hypothetical protein
LNSFFFIKWLVLDGLKYAGRTKAGRTKALAELNKAMSERLLFIVVYVFGLVSKEY